MQDKILNTGLLSYEIYSPSDIIISEESLDGCNQKETLIILSLNEKETTVSDDLLNFLKQILKAINFDLENDVSILQIKSTNNIQLADLKKLVNIKYVINFGMPLKHLGLNLENNFLYKPVTLNGITLINANRLENIHINVNLKKHFWNSLKETFLN